MLNHTKEEDENEDGIVTASSVADIKLIVILLSF